MAHGEKVFTLYPPCDALFLKESSFSSGIFKKEAIQSMSSSDSSSRNDNDVHHVQRKFMWKVEQQLDGPRKEKKFLQKAW